MASHPHLLSTVPLLLGLLADGPSQTQGTPGQNPTAEPHSGPDGGGGGSDDVGGGGENAQEAPDSTPRLDQAMAADCYQILEAVCSLETGPEQLLSRGAVPTLCRAIEHNQVDLQAKYTTVGNCIWKYSIFLVKYFSSNTQNIAELVANRFTNLVIVYLYCLTFVHIH